MNQNRTNVKRALLVLAPLALALQACAYDPSGPASQRNDLRAARTAWERQGITSYRYTLYKVCGECPSESVAPARVEVRDGRTVSVTPVNPARPIRAEYFDEYDTIEDLFATVQGVIDHDPYRFSAVYDARRGYPLSYSVDYDRRMVDDEAGFTLTDFEVVR
ncbi:MAG: hypothetical protein JO040_11065 [Gemmatimonadetes bacterium]|nr:hypothetical protein [Gemmatimonadota bacterium]